MCGRFTLRTRAADLVKFFDLEGSIADLSSRWNVAPTQQVLEELKSFLVPYPSDEMKVEEVSTVINNARNEVAPRLTKNDGYEYFASFHRN